jgi:tRNA-dihydrouridine synthase
LCHNQNDATLKDVPVIAASFQLLHQCYNSIKKRHTDNVSASMLTLHGRTRHENETKIREANWDAIRQVVDLLGHQVPILANGGISNMDDVRRCLEFTGADGVMSSEAILEYPPLFTETNIEATNYKRTGPGRMQLAFDYLELCKLYPPNEGGQGSGLKCIRAHLHRFLYTDLQQHTVIRDYLIHAFSMEQAMDEVVNMVRQVQNETEHDVSEEQLSWYTRHRSGDIVVMMEWKRRIMTTKKKKRRNQLHRRKKNHCLVSCLVVRFVVLMVIINRLNYMIPIA